MLYSNVLVAFDQSATAREALETAIALVKDDDCAKIIALHVISGSEEEDPTFSIAASKSGVSQADIAKLEKERAAGMQSMVAVKVDEIAGDDASKVSTVVINGKPASTIIEYAETNGCDLIVMGCRGLNALRGVIGSVSAAVLRNSSVPVLVIK